MLFGYGEAYNFMMMNYLKLMDTSILLVIIKNERQPPTDFPSLVIMKNPF